MTLVGKGKEVVMSINYSLLGQRIAHCRSKAVLSQDKLSEVLHVSNKHISNIELGKARPSLDLLVALANALHVSADDLLVDSLEHSVSTADSEMHRILLDCTPDEEAILVRNAEALKSILYSLGI